MVFSTDTITEINAIYNDKKSSDANDPIIPLRFDQIMIDSEKEFRTLMNKTYNKPEEDLKNTPVEDFKNTILVSLNQFKNTIAELTEIYSKIYNTSEFITSKSQFKDIKTIEYYRPYYLYKNLDLEKSFTSFYSLINNEIRELSKDIKKINSTDNINDLSIITQNNIRELDNLDFSINAIRGIVLGSDTPINKDDFASELFNYFRYVDTVEDNTKITRSRLEEAIDSYFNSDKLVDKLNKLSTKFISDTEKSVKELEELKILQCEYPFAIKSVCMGRSFRVKAICDIYKLLFISKLSAIDEYTKLNKNILLIAIGKDAFGEDIISKEMYVFDYQRLMATLEYYDDIIDIYSNIVLYEADNDRMVRNEFTLNALRKYILKINRSVEQVWQKFNTGINDPKNKKFLQDIYTSGKFKNYKQTIKLNKIRVYKLDSLDTIKIGNFDFETNKEKYKSKEQYYKTSYSGLYVLDNKNIKKAMNKKFISIANFIINPNSIGDIYRFVTKDIYAFAAELERNIKSLSNSTVTIGNKINNESVEFDAYAIYNEAITGINMKQNTSLKNKIKNNIPSVNRVEDDNPDKVEKVKGASYSDAVEIYLKISCDILSTKMNILFKAYNDYISMLNNIFNKKKK